MYFRGRTTKGLAVGFGRYEKEKSRMIHRLSNLVHIQRWIGSTEMDKMVV